jgi:hypothetical protein
MMCGYAIGNFYKQTIFSGGSRASPATSTRLRAGEYS